jgi:hypothetical protein
MGGESEGTPFSHRVELGILTKVNSKGRQDLNVLVNPTPSDAGASLTHQASQRVEKKGQLDNAYIIFEMLWKWLLAL